VVLQECCAIHRKRAELFGKIEQRFFCLWMAGVFACLCTTSAILIKRLSPDDFIKRRHTSEQGLGLITFSKNEEGRVRSDSLAESEMSSDSVGGNDSSPGEEDEPRPSGGHHHAPPGGGAWWHAKPVVGCADVCWVQIHRWMFGVGHF
jgi:hypothetical protein